MCLTVFLHNLSLSPLVLPLDMAPCTSYSIHIFVQSLSSVCNICPYHHKLFCCSIEIMSSNLSLSLERNTTWNSVFYLNMSHIHLAILVSACWSATSFSFPTDWVSHVAYYFAHLLYSLSLSIQWCILIGKKWYQLPEVISCNSVLQSDQ